jgi:hypothetical protein
MQFKYSYFIGLVLTLFNINNAGAATVLASSYQTANVLKFDALTGAYESEFIAAGSGGLSQPQGFVFGNDGKFYISSFGSKEIKRYDANTGAFIDNFATLGSGSRGLAFDDNNNLYAAFSNSVNRYDSAGALDAGFTHTFASTATGILQGADNNIYVSWGTAASPGGIAKYDVSTSTWNDTWRTGITPLPDNSWYMAMDAGGTFHLALSDGRIYKDNGTSLVPFTEAVGLSVIDRPRGLTFDPVGDLLVGSFGAVSKNSLLKFDGTTGAYEGAFISNPGLSQGFYLGIKPVPLPAASWLFVSAIASLACRCRYRK